MAEYIDREALLHDIEQSVVYTAREKITSAEMRGAHKIIERIKCAPAVDVAPVVHCRHCRSYNKPRLGWCSVHLDREGPDDFCGYGVRMDGDAE